MSGNFDDLYSSLLSDNLDSWSQEFSVGHQPLSAVRNAAQVDRNQEVPPASSAPSYQQPANSSMMYEDGFDSVPFQNGAMDTASYDTFGHGSEAFEDEEACSLTCGVACGTACEDPNCDESFIDVHHGPPCDDEMCNPETRCTDNECYPAHANCSQVDYGQFYQPHAYPMGFPAHNNVDHMCIQPCLLHHQHNMHVTAHPTGFHQWSMPAPSSSSSFNQMPPPVSELKSQPKASEPPSPAILQSPVVFPSIENDSGAPRKCCWVINPQTGATCGEILQNTGELFQHCNEVHVPEAQRRTTEGKKITGDWICYWDDCGRCKGGVRKAFKTRSKLERHLQSHAGHKPWKCEVCGLELSAKQALDQHRRIHTGEEPFRCSEPGCNKSFKQQSALTMHMRTHTGDKPLQCEICGAKFSESSNLAKHRNMHSDPKYECGYCDKKFHRRDQQKKHEERIHGVDPSKRGSPDGSGSSPTSTSLAPSATPSVPPPMSLPPQLYYFGGVGTDDGFM